MRPWPLLIALLAVPSYAGNIVASWANDGSYKLARQDRYPLGVSTNTLSTNWDGVTAKLYGARNESLGLVVYLGAGASDATNVNLSLSHFTGPGSDIYSPTVSSMSVFDWSDRNVEIFYVRYLQIKGKSRLMVDPSEYEERHSPVRWRRPYTVGGNGQGSPSGLYTDIPDHDKFYPEILIPYEAVAASSFTIAASSSQAIWIDVFVPKGQTPGDYTATLNIYEGVTLSTSMPITLHVYNFTLPDEPSFKMVGHISDTGISTRHFGSVGTFGVEPGYSVRKRYRQMLKRHKFAGVTDNMDLGTGDRPYRENENTLNGNLFSSTTGYGSAPGIDTGFGIYFIGTYGQHYTGWAGETNTTTFCSHVDNWATWFRDNYPTTKAYLYLTDEPSDLTLTNKWSTWMSTACAHTATYRLKSLVTVSHNSANSGAPYLTTPVSTSYMGASSSTITTVVSSYTTNQTEAWFYNSYSPWTGLTMTEADGYEPREIPLGAYKKGIRNWFYWMTTYFTNENNAYCRSGTYKTNNDIWNNAQTFGCTDSLAYNTTRGMQDYQFANGDGVMMYPLTDTQDTSNNYGLPGPAASWRLKMFRRGIQDVDYLVMAYSANPSSTLTNLNTLVGGRVMWEYNCFTQADCTYGYGERGFSQTYQDYPSTKVALAALIAGDSSTSSTKSISGKFKFTGGGIFR